MTTKGRPPGPSTPARAPAPQQQEQALVQHPEDALIRSPVASIEGYYERVAQLQRHFNFVSPLAMVDALPPMSQISFRTVVIDPDPEKGRDVYYDARFCRPGEVALGKLSILKLMAAAGLQKTDSERVDDGSIPYFWRWRVMIVGLDYDGTYRHQTATKELDLRDGSPETLKPEWACSEHGTDGCRCAKQKFRKTGDTVSLDATALAEKRRHGPANCETKALLRACREFFTLPHTLPAAVLRKRFVVPKLVPLLDESDPDVKRALIEQRVFGATTLYGPGARLPQGEVSHVEDAQREGVRKALANYQGRVEGRTIDLPAGRPEPDRQVIEDDAPFGPPPGVEPEPAPAPEADGAVCCCPCAPGGCGAAVDAPAAERSVSVVGDVRCGACFPDERFDFARHPAGMDLAVAAFPGATPERVKDWNARRAAKRARR